MSQSDQSIPLEGFPTFDLRSSPAPHPPTHNSESSTSPLPQIPTIGQTTTVSGVGRRDLVALPDGAIASQAAAAATTEAPSRRGRARTATLVGARNPLECPITPAEQQLANLARQINRANEREAALPSRSLRVRAAPPVEVSITEVGESSPPKASSTAEDSSFNSVPLPSEASSHLPRDSEQPCFTPLRDQPVPPVEPANLQVPPHLLPLAQSLPFPPVEHANLRGPPPNPPVQQTLTSNHHFTFGDSSRGSRPTSRPSSVTTFEPRHPRPSPPPSPRVVSSPAFTPPQSYRGQDPTSTPELVRRIRNATAAMNSYPNYNDSTGGAPNARQAPPSPSQHQNGMNGGGMGMAGGMVGFPTPAGHQSDLNYIMQMVEELAGQLAHNQGLTAGIVDKMGKVRAKAKGQELSNDELLAMAAAELNVSTENIEKENSELRKALEKALVDKKENWELAVHGANILSDVLEKMHRFKATHETDTLAWHKNYRKQLADEREENLNLRCQINDMKAAAARANEHLRQMRRYLTDHDELNELRIQNHQFRLERRSWKRMALPLLRDSDSEFSDDDDIIDPEEKKRLAAEKAEKDRKDKEGAGETAGPIA